MGVELHYQRVLAVAGQFLIDRQNAEMVAGDPEQEIAFGPDLTHRLPARSAPVLVRLQRLESELAEADLALVGAGPRRHLFAPVVGQDFAKLVGQQLRPGAGARAAEQVEGEEDGGGSSRAGRQGRTLARLCQRGVSSLARRANGFRRYFKPPGANTTSFLGAFPSTSARGIFAQDLLDLLAVQLLLLQQGLDQAVQLVAVSFQQLVGPLVGLAEQALHFLVDDLRRSPR